MANARCMKLAEKLCKTIIRVAKCGSWKLKAASCKQEAESQKRKTEIENYKKQIIIKGESGIFNRIFTLRFCGSRFSVSCSASLLGMVDHPNYAKRRRLKLRLYRGTNKIEYLIIFRFWNKTAFSFFVRKIFQFDWSGSQVESLSVYLGLG